MPATQVLVCVGLASAFGMLDGADLFTDILKESGLQWSKRAFIPMKAGPIRLLPVPRHEL